MWNKLLTKLMLWALNKVLKKVLATQEAELKQKQLVVLANTIIDSIRDHQLSEEEWERIMVATSNAFNKADACVH